MRAPHKKVVEYENLSFAIFICFLPVMRIVFNRLHTVWSVEHKQYPKRCGEYGVSKLAE